MDSAELFKALLQFFFLFGLVLVLAWLTTRFVGQRMGSPMGGSSLRVLQHLPAGRDRSIMLLEVGGRVYLLGITAQQVTLLDAIDDPEVLERVLANVPAAGELPLTAALPRSFAEVLGRLTGRAGPQKPGTNEAPPSGEPAAPTDSGPETTRLREQIERLRRMQNR